MSSLDKDSDFFYSKYKAMTKMKPWLLCLLGLGTAVSSSAHINPSTKKPAPKPDNRIEFRMDCDNAVERMDMRINNVRARLLTGGDLWWDGNSNGLYIIPNVPAGETAVSSIFAGAVWTGGFDPGGNLKLAAQTYGRSTGDFDFYPGPLTPLPDPDDEDAPPPGITEQSICDQWDRFFVVDGKDIDKHIQQYEAAQRAGTTYEPALIPESIRGWPARGNEFFFDVHQFELPNTSQGLAGFWDQDGNGLYEPDQGDFPIIEIRGCNSPKFPDQMVFWIYNDAGNIHAESEGDPLQMEFQVQAFAFNTNDEINDMSFYRYKLINRAVERIDSTFFAWWVDPDLGCHEDDYIGCDVDRSLAYVYNEDVLDGNPEGSCLCPLGVTTYCGDVPILGYDYFRGPLDEFGEEIGMSTFTYYNNASVGSWPNGTTDPQNSQEYFNYLSGTWRDGNPFTFGGDAYQDGEPVNYVFSDPPDAVSPAWSMCTAGLGFGDRRTIQASGPFRLDPGAINELIIGVVWVPDQFYPCPSIRKLQEADDIAQSLFDNCFGIKDGPDAPDVDWIELDQEIIAILTNDSITSNNAFEGYTGPGLQIPEGEEDSVYVFEGYKLFQLAGPTVSIADLDDPDKARLIYQADQKNGVGEVYNWIPVPPEENPTGEEYFVPQLKVAGADAGIRHTFRITEDQFAEGDRRLINHKKYYFVALAYAYNNYFPFDPEQVLGQKSPYCEGRRNIGDGVNSFYTVIPRPITDRKLNASFGDGAIITRIDGVGAGGNFLDISEDTRAIIENDIRNGTKEFEGQITYRPGSGPVEVHVFNPLDVMDGEFELTFIDEDMSNDQLDHKIRWKLTNLTDPDAPVVFSDRSIEQLNEQIIKAFGFSVTIGQTTDFGETGKDKNGVIEPGIELEYLAGEKATPWLTGIPDGTIPGIGNFLDQVIFNYIDNGQGGVDELLDQDQALNNIGPGYFVPFLMADWRSDFSNDLPFITPAWSNEGGSNLLRGQMKLEDINNVDIVFTKDKSLWSRAVIVETANRYYYNSGGQFGAGLPGGKPSAELGDDFRINFDLRSGASVTKYDKDGDGLPDPDDSGTTGLGWFPGYAVDVETGQRLYVFFGENSVYDCAYLESLGLSNACNLFADGTGTGGDMMFNPTAEGVLQAGNFANVLNYYMGGQHFVYVSKLPYEEGAVEFETKLRQSGLSKFRAIRELTWAGMLMLENGASMGAYGAGEEGLIPDDLVVKLRGDNPYQVAFGTGDFNGYPTYRFKLEGLQADELTPTGVETALDLINVVPNPYYAFSEYENNPLATTVKITNLPPRCVVTIFSLDGRFIRKYNRDELAVAPEGNNRALELAQILPDLEWDLKNAAGIPISSGIYLIHIDAPGLGERTLKWFGINRKFDPSGL